MNAQFISDYRSPYKSSKTNPLCEDMENESTTTIRAEADIWRDLAKQEGISRNEFKRRANLEGIRVRYPVEHAKIVQIREERAMRLERLMSGVRASVLLFVMMASLVLSLFVSIEKSKAIQATKSAGVKIAKAGRNRRAFDWLYDFETELQHA